MTEKEWVELLAARIEASCISHSEKLSIHVGMKLPYGYEISEYAEEPISKAIKYQTDLLIIESFPNERWKPRLVMECKVTISTHDAITYSHKAFTHKSVHPYLRYGILLGNHKFLPGRLYRHGMFFDFMMSFGLFEPSETEMVRFTHLIHDEIEASRNLEKIIYESKKKQKDKYTLLHRQLSLR